jgi:hypothetical protein
MTWIIACGFAEYYTGFPSLGTEEVLEDGPNPLSSGSNKCDSQVDEARSGIPDADTEVITSSEFWANVAHENADLAVSTIGPPAFENRMLRVEVLTRPPKRKLSLEDATSKPRRSKRLVRDVN